tara:strand:- start:438 stop:614 length:177 start_codon:yes stop_codon:yes gene_type:complete
MIIVNILYKGSWVISKRRNNLLLLKTSESESNDGKPTINGKSTLSKIQHFLFDKGFNL